LVPKEIELTTQIKQWRIPMRPMVSLAEKPTVRKGKRSREMSLEVRDSQRGKTMAKYTLISLCKMAPSRANGRRRKTFSFAAAAGLLLLAIGTSACLYTPAVPEDPTPIPGWNENKSQLQKNGIQLQQSADGHSDSSSEVAIAAKPSPSTP
jgi:hypothetical protein